MKLQSLRLLALSGLVSLSTLAAATAADVSATAEGAYKEIERTFGAVPDFAKRFPKAGIAGAWAEVRDLELSDKTALPPKVKALVALGVAAQIPCSYCIYQDTLDARRAGASDEEIAEAVGIAALTRHWSTVLNGLQIDLATFKKEVGGDTQ